MKTIYYQQRIYLNYEEPFILQAYVGAYEKHLSSLTSYPIIPLEGWKDGDLLEEGKDFNIKYEYFYNGKWSSSMSGPDGEIKSYIENGEQFRKVAVAIPEKQNDIMKTDLEKAIEIVKQARAGEIDQDFRSIIFRLEQIKLQSHPTGQTVSGAGVWVRCYDDVPGITKYYVIRNWITGKDGATVYCDSKDAILNYCKVNNLDFPEFEWLDESASTLQQERAEGVKENDKK